MRAGLYLSSLSILLLSCGSGTEGARVGEECAENDLVAQCPPNTTPDLMAEASSSCDTSGSVNIDNDADGGTSLMGNNIERACVGTGSCRVVCRFNNPCQYGVQSVSATNGIICAEPPAGCGDGECGPGENPEVCPIDCGGDCVAGEMRCDGDQISRCTPRLRWEEPIDCGSGQACSVVDGVAACSPTGGAGGAGGDGGAGGAGGEGGAGTE